MYTVRFTASILRLSENFVFEGRSRVEQNIKPDPCSGGSQKYFLATEAKQDV